MQNANYFNRKIIGNCICVLQTDDDEEENKSSKWFFRLQYGVFKLSKVSRLLCYHTRKRDKENKMKSNTIPNPFLRWSNMYVLQNKKLYWKHEEENVGSSSPFFDLRTRKMIGVYFFSSPFLCFIVKSFGLTYHYRHLYIGETSQIDC